MITRKQGCSGSRMRVSSLFFVAAVLVLFIDEQCAIVALRVKLDNSAWNSVYRRAELVCHDKLEVWRNSSTSKTTTGNVSSPLGSGSNHLGSSIRGKWKPMSSSPSSAVVLPKFLTGNGGKFDLYSSQMRGLAEDSKGPTIQNISGRLYFFNDKHRYFSGGSLEVTGIFDRDSGEVCFVGCVPDTSIRWAAQQNLTNITSFTNSTAFQPVFTNSDEACIVHGELTVARGSKSSRTPVSGSLTSLIINSSAEGYFTGVRLDGVMMDNNDQRRLYRIDLLVRSAIFAVEAIILMWQIFHSIRSPESYFVSMLMIIVQIVVIFFLSGYLIYMPIRLLTVARFKYLPSLVSLVPLLVLLVVIFLNVVFLLVILRKRFVAKRLNVVARPKELLLGIICLIIYGVTAIAVWSTHNFDTYVQVVWCWFLLPQVIANIFWDLRVKPLHWIYVVGISLCRVAYVGFQAVRPTIYGFDDLTGFPHGWFWGIFFTVLFFGSYALVQQNYSGRCFLPQSWFGYKTIPGSKSEANQERYNSKDEDTMLDL